MWAVVFFGFVIGTIIGSFVCATAERVITNKSIGGRSYCPSCKKYLRWYDLFPLISYLLLKGRCRNCKKTIPLEYFLTEIISGLLFGILFYTIGGNLLSSLAIPSAQFWTFLLEICFLVFAVTILEILFIIDLKTGLLPDRITYPAIIIALVFLLVKSLINSWVFYKDVVNSPLGPYLMHPYSSYLETNLFRIWEKAGFSILSGVISATVFILLIIVTRGKGMGWGDVKYVLFLGLILGFPNIIVAIFMAFLSGAVISLLLIVASRKKFGQTIPFGPFLSLGSFIALLWGSQIIDWYLQLTLRGV